jgi:hypothetical protein
LQYYIEVASGEAGVCRVRLEYTQDGGLRWRTEKDGMGDNVDHTGTVASPLEDLVALAWVKNETPKNKLYRWNFVSFDRTNSNTVTAHLSNHNPGRVHLYGDVYVIVQESQPLSGTDGDGANFAGTGSEYHCIGNPSGIYRNEGTATMPIWKAM